MKTKITTIVLICLILFSCNRNKEESKEDIEKTLLSIPQEKYTKIESPSEIDVDTIKGDSFDTEMTIKNIGNQTLTNLLIKTTCSCTTLTKYPSELKSGDSTKVKLKIEINKKGYFCKKVYLYGSFNPLFKVVNITGYKQ